jgi:drug/metabolite transporter (DMT)-like permease
MSYVFIALTIALTVYGQLVLKWRVSQLQIGSLSDLGIRDGIAIFADLWVLSAFGSAFGASLCWMAAISGLPLSKAYPFMALNFVIVTILASLLFQEVLTAEKMAGITIIIFGVIVVSRSAV